MTVLEFKNVNKIYKKNKALDNFSWHVEDGKIHSLLGHNGAGKTTSFLIANNLIPYNSGEISIFGKDIKDLSKKDTKNIGFLTEKLKLYDELSVKDVLNFFCDIFGLKNKKTIIDEIAERFQMKDFLKKDVKKLSTGMYKKTAIAITLLNDPDVIFLDEPFAGLDPIIVKEISSILTYYSQNKNKTIILSSHNLHEIEAVSDYVTIMKDGKKIISENIQDLFRKFSLEKSFNISYLKNGKDITENLKDEKLLAQKITELESNKNPIMSISENKISLSDIYNKIYSEIEN